MATYKWNPEHKFLYTTDAEGEYHSFNDMPAIETFDGSSDTYIWMTHGNLDRDCTKGPAFINNVGWGKCSYQQTKYFKMGKLYEPNGKQLTRPYFSKNPDKYIIKQKIYIVNNEIICPSDYIKEDVLFKNIYNQDDINVFIKNNIMYFISKKNNNIIHTISSPNHRIYDDVSDLNYGDLPPNYIDNITYETIRIGCGCVVSGRDGDSVYCMNGRTLMYCRDCKKITPYSVTGVKPFDR